MKSWTKGDRVVQPTYGLGTLVEVNDQHTVIDFDEHGRRTFCDPSRHAAGDQRAGPGPRRPQARQQEDEGSHRRQGSQRRQDRQGRQGRQRGQGVTRRLRDLDRPFRSKRRFGNQAARSGRVYASAASARAPEVLVRKNWIAGVMISDSTIEIRMPADDRDRQRLQHLRSRAERERQRQHARHRRQRRHHDRPQPAASGLNDGLFGRESDRPELLVGVEQQDAVLGDDADDHDQSHERRDIERGPA